MRALNGLFVFCLIHRSFIGGYMPPRIYPYSVFVQLAPGLFVYLLAHFVQVTEGTCITRAGVDSDGGLRSASNLDISFFG